MVPFPGEEMTIEGAGTERLPASHVEHLGLDLLSLPPSIQGDSFPWLLFSFVPEVWLSSSQQFQNDLSIICCKSYYIIK